MEEYTGILQTTLTSLMAQMVKHLPTMREIWVRSLDREDPLEKGMATTEVIQYSCLETSMDRGAWQATVNELAKSQTQLSD